MAPTAGSALPIETSAASECALRAEGEKMVACETEYHTEVHTGEGPVRDVKRAPGDQRDHCDRSIDLSRERERKREMKREREGEKCVCVCVCVCV